MTDKINNLIDLDFNNGIFKRRIINDNYDIYYNDIIEDEYCNYGTVTNKNEDIKKICSQIYNEMKNLNRKPVLYSLTKLDNDYLKELYIDTWIMLDDLNDFPKYESDLDINVELIKESEINEYVDAVIKGYSTGEDDDPYGNLPDSYGISMLKSFNKSYDCIRNYAARYNNKIIGTATIIYKGNYAILYNVTTNKKYKNHGVFKELMSEVITDLKNIGVTTIGGQTEKDYYPEIIYKKIGFKEIMLGRAYEIKEENL